MSTPKVSILTTAYNHEYYIAQAVTSAMTQITNFDYKMVIGEDYSTDRTRDILIGLKERFPHKIDLLLRPTNWGGRRNFLGTLHNCQGDYIAILEGDDLWISSNKLQLQADFLDSHPDCALCFHPVIKFFENENRVVLFEPFPVKEVYTLDDLLKRNFIATCSVMFRNRLLDELPDWIHDTPAADWPLHILNAQRGNIGYIDRTMGIHRIHSGGVWSANSAMKRLQNKIVILETIKDHFGHQYSQKLDQIISQQHLKVIWLLFRNGKIKAVYSYLSKLLSNPYITTSSLLKAMLRSKK